MDTCYALDSVVHPNSNHSPSIIQYIPFFVERWIRIYTSDKDAFDEYSGVHNKVLMNCCYMCSKIKFRKHDDSGSKKYKLEDDLVHTPHLIN